MGWEGRSTRTDSEIQRDSEVREESPLPGCKGGGVSVVRTIHGIYFVPVALTWNIYLFVINSQSWESLSTREPFIHLPSTPTPSTTPSRTRLFWDRQGTPGELSVVSGDTPTDAETVSSPSKDRNHCSEHTKRSSQRRVLLKYTVLYRTCLSLSGGECPRGSRQRGFPRGVPVGGG